MKTHEELLKEYKEYCEETALASNLGSQRILGFKEWLAKYKKEEGY